MTYKSFTGLLWGVFSSSTAEFVLCTLVQISAKPLNTQGGFPPPACALCVKRHIELVLEGSASQGRSSHSWRSWRPSPPCPEGRISRYTELIDTVPNTHSHLSTVISHCKIQTSHC